MAIQTLVSMLLCTACSLTLASISYASGSFSGTGRVSGFGNERKVDQFYEVGKAIYSGRLKDTAKIDYCVDTGTEIVALSRKSIKPYKKKAKQTLFENLYNCDNTEKIVAYELGADKTSYLIYYLDKRYKLKMTE